MGQFSTPRYWTPDRDLKSQATPAESITACTRFDSSLSWGDPSCCLVDECVCGLRKRVE